MSLAAEKPSSIIDDATFVVNGCNNVGGQK